MRTVFVVGLDDFNLQTMRGLREFSRYDVRPLLPTELVLKAEHYDYDQLVADADAELRRHDGPVDAVLTWWDFPSSGLVPLISELWDVPGPDLRSVLNLEHKYWSRTTQRAVAGEHVPPFAVFDPQDEAVLETIRQQGVELPFWVKPVKSVASYLGFRIDSASDLEEALPTLRAGVAEFGDPFQQALDHVELPTDIASVGGRSCVAEGLVAGRQCTLEGYVMGGAVTIYGAVDTLRAEDTSTIRAYHYPSTLPSPVLHEMAGIVTDVVTEAGLDHSCFNVEFFYDEDAGQIWILEVNTRLSASHCELFARVDGATSQRVLLDVTRGHGPRMPHRRGDHPAAGKYFLRAREDGVVRRVPDQAALDEVEKRFPGTRVDIDVQTGDRLSETLRVQETYSFELGRVWCGGQDHDDLEKRFAEIADLVGIDIE